MTNIISRYWAIFLLLAAATSFAGTAFAQADELPASGVAGLSHIEALAAGEKMYREGMLSSGESMQAIVQGDITVDGSMFSCESCHLRSGLGAAEGRVIVFPTNGSKLFIPLHRGAEIQINPTRDNLAQAFQGGDVRPAYNEETLANALWLGDSPNGEKLIETMPRYHLDETEMSILIYYLKHLSAEFSSGVTDDTMYLATILTDDVSQQDREAYLKTLKAYIKIRNSQNRHQSSRAKRGPWYRQERFTSYRDIDLSVWELSGARETWPQQLEKYYKENPVFALIGGISSGDWAPIHHFCEQNQLPNLFPITDQPVVSETDWYTLYFSKGPHQEGEAVARYLRGTGSKKVKTPIVQIYRSTPFGARLAEGFRRTWKNLGMPNPAEIRLEAGEPLDNSTIRTIINRYPGATFLLWLSPEDRKSIEVFADANTVGRIFVSAGQLGKETYALSKVARKKSFISYPYRLPEQRERLETVVIKWLETHKVPITNLDIQSKVYFTGWMLSGGLRKLGNEYYRDYFLDVLDMMNDEYSAIVNYPRVSFGQGQRYAAKGCYIVQLSQDEKPELIPRSNWVVQ